jgi:hypothetical protein
VEKFISTLDSKWNNASWFDAKIRLFTRGMACVGKCFENKISKPTKLDCKQNFYCTVYNITSNSNCEAQRLKI